jgi:beta-fructofuranosidase
MNLTTSIENAMQALAAAAPQAQADPARPHYHFTAPAGWLNDPNGTIFHQGWYHLFYQHHPYSDSWGPMHWGHARSRDLLHWEHLPVALAPAMDGIENGVWSGCIAVDDAGTPLAIYTAASMPGAPDVPLACQQFAALGSPDLLTWEKWAGNPLLQRDPAWRAEWRDPFLFQAAGRTFLVVGMCGPGTPLFEALDGSLLRWAYRGLLCAIDAECPNFFQVDGGQWVFLSSPFHNVRWAVGSFDADAGRFTIEHEGRYDWSEFGHSDAYATNHLYAPDGRSILFAWIRGWDTGHGWNGCMALPREVHLAADGTLRTPPIAEIAQLRGTAFTHPAGELPAGRTPLAFDPGEQYELHLRLACGGAARAGVGLRRSAAGDCASALWLDAEGVHLDGVLIPLSAAQPVDVRLFVDHSVAELFVNQGQYCAVRVCKDYRPGETGIELFSEGGTAVLDGLELYRLGETANPPRW